MNSFKFILLVLLFINCTIGLDLYKKSLTKTLSFKPGDNLFVETENGSVEISSWEREEIKIEGIKKARAETEEKAMKMIEDIEINISEDKEVVKIKARGGNNSWVDLNILVPRKANPIIETKNGSVEIRDLDGTIEVKTNNGSIGLSDIKGKVKIAARNGSFALRNILSSKIEAKTNNGSIEFDVDTFIKPTDISLETNNGSIYVSIPEDPELSIYATKTKIVNKISIGPINIKKNGVETTSDFPIYTLKEQLKGEIKLKLETENGSIVIKKK